MHEQVYVWVMYKIFFVEKKIVTIAWSSFGELVPNILSLLFFIIEIIILKIWNKLIIIKFH